MTTDSAEELRQIILKVVKTYEVRLRRRDEFGQRYTLDFTLEWQDEKCDHSQCLDYRKWF